MLSATGLKLEEIYDLPLDVFHLYLASSSRLEARRRLGYIADTTASVASLFSSGNKIKEYANGLEKQSLGDDDE